MNSSAQQKNIPGGLVPVDPNSPKIQEIAAWAVNEYNKEHDGANLKFERATKAEQEVVAGTMYYIDLEASIGTSGITNKYFAKVFEQVWTNTLKLEEFKPMLQENARVAIAN